MQPLPIDRTLRPNELHHGTQRKLMSLLLSDRVRDLGG
jgi:hypothetical protein